MSKSSLKIKIFSNGFGEDNIACNLIKELKKKENQPALSIIPLVGPGLEYKKLGLAPLIENPTFPSGGFLRDIKTILKDIKAGLISHFFKQVTFIRALPQDQDYTIAVGDFFCLFMSKLNNQKPIYFLPTAKSDLFMKHYSIETHFIKKWATAVFPRDLLTTKALIKTGIAAHYCGNPMMDNLIWSGQTFGFTKNTDIIGILPGSRKESYKNLLHILKVIEALNYKNPNIRYLLAKAKSFDLKTLQEKLANTPWTLNSKNILQHKNKTISIIISEDFADIVHVSKTLVGLSGTANEQAIYLGKQVLCFEGFGPQTTKLRFSEQKKLLGNNLTFIDDRSPSNIANILIQKLTETKNTTPATTHQNASQNIISHIASSQDKSSFSN
jgi:uncharacterized protein (TIGR03492 family)